MNALYRDGDTIRAMDRGWDLFARALLPVENQPAGQMRMRDWWDTFIGAPLWSKQYEIMDLVDDNRYVAVASAVGIGKSETAAAIVAAFLHTRDRAIAITTAPTDNLVKTVLWKYIQRIYNQNRDVMRGRVLQKEWQIAPDHYGLGFKASDTEADRFRGLHATSGNILTIIDEAQGVHDNVIDVLHNTMSSANARLFMIGNPTSLSGRFREAFHERADAYTTMTIPVTASPNFTGEIDERPELAFLRNVLTTPEYVEGQVKIYGEDSDYVRGNIRAQWPRGTVNTLISLGDIETCDKQAGELFTGSGRYYAGVDVARFGDDESSVSIRFGQEEIAFAAWRGNDTVQSTRNVARILADLEQRGWDEVTKAEIRVDAVGVGGGVADQLRHDGYKVRDVNVGEASSDRTQWMNLRHELWWQMKELYEEHRIAPANERLDYTEAIREAKLRPRHVPHFDVQMRAQLSNVLYTFRPGYEKPVIEDKAAMKKRLGWSPDRAEAQMLCYGQLPRRGVVSVYGQGKASTRR